MSRFLSKDLACLEPYVPGEQPQDKRYIKLNTNESPFPPAEGVAESAYLQAEQLNLYSDPSGAPLKKAAAGIYSLSPENVSLGNGSDENLAHIFRAFLKDKGVVFPDVTYGFYPVLCSLLGIEYKTVPLRADFTVDVGDYASFGCPVCIANPNAQTGVYLPPQKIEELILQNRQRLVIIDEAYIDFGGQSAAPLVEKYDNLIVVQTMSKSRSLAGARVGFCFACKELAAEIEAVRCSFNPYNINRMSMFAAVKSIQAENYFRECTEKIKSVREYTANTLKNMGFEMTDSLSNFLLAKHRAADGGKLYLKLKERGILVRHFSDETIKDYVRVTIGTKEQMDKFIEAAGLILAEEGYADGRNFKKN